MLIKKEEKENNTVQDFNDKASNTSQETSSNRYKKESIPRVSINRLFGKKEEYLNNYIIIWGNADIESKERELENSTTKEKFMIKRLIFRVNNKFRFSIPISGTLLKYYTDLVENKTNRSFAVFGILRESKGFLELKIMTTRHLQWL